MLRYPPIFHMLVVLCAAKEEIVAAEGAKRLAEFLKENQPTDKEIQQFLYSIINDANLTKKENIERQKVNFKNLYNLLFGRNDGPRLYLFLSAAEKQDYLFLLTQN